MARKLGRNRSRCVSKISRLKDPRVQPGKGPRPTAAADSYAIFPSYARPFSTEYLHSNFLAVCQPRHLHVLDVDLTMSSVNFAVDMLLGALDFQVRNMTDSSGCPKVMGRTNWHRRARTLSLVRASPVPRKGVFHLRGIPPRDRDKVDRRLNFRWTEVKPR